MKMSVTLAKRRLQGAEFHEEDFRGLDLSSISAYGSKWFNCVFEKCDISLGDLQTVMLEDCRFTDCEIRMSNFRAARLRHVRFEECDLRQSAFTGATPLDDVTFERCKMQYTTFFDATVRRARWLRSNLHGADLRFIEMNFGDFEGSNLWNAHVQIGCQFFNGAFDQRQGDLFTAMTARRHPDQKKSKLLEDIAGRQAVGVVRRLMDPRLEAAEEAAG